MFRIVANTLDNAETLGAAFTEQYPVTDGQKLGTLDETECDQCSITGANEGAKSGRFSCGYVKGRASTASDYFRRDSFPPPPSIASCTARGTAGVLARHRAEHPSSSELWHCTACPAATVPPREATWGHPLGRGDLF